ncbi:hypothetical protein FIA58_004090 [Flavobacterium jejuense]|uniref:Uncharacterized protein n=1 Tax=Flavobacterium jejuense TaxID=1544455 RepID=A0ABX0IP63_9FLAO|nr:hypothetical protein [Flavobacterium jejuense]NHN24850.1 hypothetical protein [Flavobacterium jejuense]
MPIIRCIDQSNSNQTLIEFYKEIKKHNNAISESISSNMLKLIETLNCFFDKSEIYALTSMYSLVLLSDNTWKSKWVLRLLTNGTEYVIFESDKKTGEFNKRTVYSNENEFIKNSIALMKTYDYWNGIPELEYQNWNKKLPIKMHC